ncbi:MAG TPA: DUF3300 domain-containing protein [Thermoanaerobaculia bacterium]|nr:DUF3300 domain-containing protein [Thermoanaerobaculia bacterium]
MALRILTRSRPPTRAWWVLAVPMAAFVAPGMAAQDPAAATASSSAPAPLSASQLQSLVAPIALYPDPLLTQVLVASTYPLDVMEAQQWLAQNSGLTGSALTTAAQKQPWDPSVQALTEFPSILKQLASNVSWTTNLGNAFLAQKNDVMDAVQTLRQQAQSAGNLQSNAQQTVTTQTTDSKQYIVIQPASTQYVYVPTYNPTVVFGPPAVPYPPIWYPPPVYGGGFAVGFAAGVSFGGGWFGGGWGWGCGWGGHTTININNNNTYIHNNNIHNNYNHSGNSTWNHNPGQRGNVPYRPGTPNIPGRTYDGGGSGRDTPIRPGTPGTPGGRGGVVPPERPGDTPGREGPAAGNAQDRDRPMPEGQNREGGWNRDTQNRVGNRNVPPQRRQGAWGSGGQRARMTSQRGRQSVGHFGGNRGGARPSGGGRRR